MPEAQVIGGWSQRLDRSYALSVGLDNEGGIAITEINDYPTRGQREGRAYIYTVQDARRVRDCLPGPPGMGGAPS